MQHLGITINAKNEQHHFIQFYSLWEIYIEFGWWKDKREMNFLVNFVNTSFSYRLFYWNQFSFFFNISLVLYSLRYFKCVIQFWITEVSNVSTVICQYALMYIYFVSSLITLAERCSTGKYYHISALWNFEKNIFNLSISSGLIISYTYLLEHISAYVRFFLLILQTHKLKRLLDYIRQIPKQKRFTNPNIYVDLSSQLLHFILFPSCDRMCFLTFTPLTTNI